MVLYRRISCPARIATFARYVGVSLAALCIGLLFNGPQTALAANGPQPVYHIADLPANGSQANLQYDELWQQNGRADFSAWKGNGVAVHDEGWRSAFRLQPASGATLTCASGDIDDGTASVDPSGLCKGSDAHAPGSYDSGLNYYNGGAFYFGTVVSPVHQTRQPVTTIISSWNASTPAGTWMEVHVRVLQGANWSHWYILPIWASDFSTIHRHSVDGQSDATGSVATDTFFTNGQRATAYQLSLTLFSTSPAVSPTIWRVSALASNDVDAQHTPVIPSNRIAWGLSLPVPQRSQMLPQYKGLGYGGGGEVWCSPTSTSMVMAYWSQILRQSELNHTVPDAAQNTYDFTYEGTGNWPFNTAFAGQYGLHAFVTRMYSMSQVEQWIKVGVPIVISIAYGVGELPGSPIPSTNGHLLVVKGFAANGDVITNDPAAATDAQVQITYPRAALEKVWLNASNGTVYVIYPEHWPTPISDRFGSW